MIWHLLWLYPLIGLGLEACHHYRSRKHGLYPDNLVLDMMFLWPIGWHFNNTMFNEGVEEARLKEEAEHEALLESIRKERLAPDPRLAEFDILLGIEPEPAHWRTRHPTAGAEYDRNMVIAEQRARQFEKRMRYSNGGYIPPYRG